MNKIGILLIDYNIYLKYYRSIEFEVYKSNIQIEGMSVGFSQESDIDIIDGIKIYDVNDFFSLNMDYVIVSVEAGMLHGIKDKLGRLFPAEKIFSIEIFGITDFDFDKYIRLIDSKVTIISQNCWGGMVYHSLFHRFLSPTINLYFESDDGFIKFVSNLENYIEEKIEYAEDGQSIDGEKYPIGRIKDVRIHFLHYKTFEQAAEKWEERKKRINRKNIVVVMQTEDIEAARALENSCSYRKVIFVPDSFGLKDEISIKPLEVLDEGKNFGQYINMVAGGFFHLYDIFDLLLENTASSPRILQSCRKRTNELPDEQFWDISPVDRLKYLDDETYKSYEILGDDLHEKNPDQAYLCYENAEFLCNDIAEKRKIASKKDRLINEKKIKVNKTAFVIISYNNTYYIQRCLESIYSNCNPESYLIMVFDNGSTDGTRKWLEKWGEIHDEAIVILNDENLGFSGGNNACCQYLPEKYDVFYLNNDTRVPPNALFWMRMALYSANDVGGVGAVQNYATADQFMDVSFDLPEQYVEYGAKHNVYEENPYEEQSKICGFAMLITREMYEATKGFDEQFNPGFLEDDDLSLRIRQLGKRLLLCQNAFIYHVGSQSFKKRNDIDELFRKNQRKCIEKWGFDPTVYAAMSENEYKFIQELSERGYNRESTFSLLHIGSGCGNMLGHIRYLYPNALLAGIEKNDIVRKYAISCIPIYSSEEELPEPIDKYDLIVRNLG